MTARPDPYRVLGLVPGASAGEVRSAYRRLAKLHHPDTAGDRSLPRFLAIQAAYEALVDGEGRLRTRGWASRGGPSATRASNPGAGSASRDAWRARRAAGSSGDSGGAAGSGGQGGAGRRREGGSSPRSGPAPDGGRAGAKGPSAGAKGAGGRRAGNERRTARPGSTTYDEAAQPLDPSWDGGAWYGASSGRYWTLNPREYADPRKHGPEYQARARRAASSEAEHGAGGTRPTATEASGPDDAGVTSDTGGDAAGAAPDRR